MSIVSGIVVFVLIWWVVIFAVLPVGLERDENGTPKSLNLPRKMLITTFITIVLWIVAYFLIDAGVFSFREMAKELG